VEDNQFAVFSGQLAVDNQRQLLVAAAVVMFCLQFLVNSLLSSKKIFYYKFIQPK